MCENRYRALFEYLIHLADELIHELLPVAVVATLHKVHTLAVHAAERAVELEGPEEVVGLLEVLAAREDLVDEVLDADNALLAERLLDDVVAGQGDALTAHLAVAALVDQLAHALEVGVPVGDVGLHAAEHVDGSLVQADEHAIVDLAQAQQLQDLLRLGVHAVDTADADHERDLVLGRHVEVAGGLGLITGLCEQRPLAQSSTAD